MTPRPPALLTAAARGPEEVRAMPARITGYSMPRRSQMGVRRIGRGWVPSVEAEMFMVGDLFAGEMKMAYQGGLQERVQEWRRRGCIDTGMGDIFTTSRVACLLLVPLVDRPRFTEVVRSLGPTRAYPRCRCRCQAKSWLSWANLSIDCRQRHTITCHHHTPALLPHTSYRRDHHRAIGRRSYRAHTPSNYEAAEQRFCRIPYTPRTRMGVQKKVRKFAAVKRVIGQRDARLKKNIVAEEKKQAEKKKGSGNELIREIPQVPSSML